MRSNANLKTHKTKMARSLKKTPKLTFKRVRVNSPSIRHKPDSNSIERDQRIEFLGGGGGGSINSSGGGSSSRYDNNSLTSGSDGNGNSDGEEVAENVGNRVMVVVDNGLASVGALEWAMSHTLQSRDTLLLLHVSKPPSRKGRKKLRKRNIKVNQLLQTWKNMCQAKKPGIEVEIRRVEGKEKEKGAKIVEEAKKEEVSLLVVGQEKKPSVWRLFKRWAWKRRRGCVIDYCIQNASCMTIAVKPKSRRLGGYLITTKRHNNFWLLA